LLGGGGIVDLVGCGVVVLGCFAVVLVLLVVTFFVIVIDMLEGFDDLGDFSDECWRDGKGVGVFWGRFGGVGSRGVTCEGKSEQGKGLSGGERERKVYERVEVPRKEGLFVSGGRGPWWIHLLKESCPGHLVHFQ
jgi:hypothetical protein